MNKLTVTKDLEKRTLTIERTFDAPRAKVWRAFADKDWFVRWWGPEGWETTVKEFDFVPGGRNHYCMKCVDKNQGEWFSQEAWGLMEFETINRPSDFSYADLFADADGNVAADMPKTITVVELKEQNGKTTLLSRTQADSAGAIEKLLAMGMVEGVSGSYDKLERLLTN